MVRSPLLVVGRLGLVHVTHGTVIFEKFEVLAAMFLEGPVAWNVRLCCLVASSRRFERCIASSESSGSRRPLQGDGITIIRNVGELLAQ